MALMVWTYWRAKLKADGELVDQFNYNPSESIVFCESCFGGKQHHAIVAEANR